MTDIMKNLPDFEKTLFKNLPEDVKEALLLYMLLVAGMYDITPEIVEDWEFSCKDNMVSFKAKIINPGKQAYIKID